MEIRITKGNFLTVIMLFGYLANLFLDGFCGYKSDSMPFAYLIYQFQHASIFLLIANLIAFRYPIKVVSLLFGGDKIFSVLVCYLISACAASLDNILIPRDIETVGMSGMVCAAWGLDLASRYYGFIRSLERDKYLLYMAIIFTVLITGLFIPVINGTNHLISFILAWLLISIKYWKKTRED